MNIGSERLGRAQPLEDAGDREEIQYDINKIK